MMHAAINRARLVIICVSSASCSFKQTIPATELSRFWKCPKCGGTARSISDQIVTKGGHDHGQQT